MVEIDTIKLADINKAEYNPRTISEENYQKLKNSVKNFGLVEPILINLKNNTIISGHQRYDVLIDLILTDGNLAEKEFHLLKYGDYGLILDTDEPTLKNEDWEKALNITLNNTNLTGDYDFEKLGSLLDELTLSDLDVSLTGFDDFELEFYSSNYDDFGDSLFEYNDDDDEFEGMDDFSDVEGELYNQNFLITIGFKTREDANQFLELLHYPRKLDQSTLQFMFEEIDLDVFTDSHETQDEDGIDNEESE